MAMTPDPLSQSLTALNGDFREFLRAFSILVMFISSVSNLNVKLKDTKQCNPT